MEQARIASNLVPRPAAKQADGREHWTSEPSYSKSILMMKQGSLATRQVYRLVNKGYSHANHRYAIIRATTTFDFNSAPLDHTTSTFPFFLPPQVRHLQDSAARAIALRIQRLPVQTTLAENPIMSSCVKPAVLSKDLPPVCLLHGFDSSCLEWKNTYPMLEKANMECWALDILGWGFSHSEDLSSVGVAAKREHLYEVSKLVLINAQGYAKGTGTKAKFPRFIAYAGVYILKNVLLRTYANLLIHYDISWNTLIDLMNVGRLHCLMPGWSKASVDFMLSGGYNVASQISKVYKETLIIWGEQDRIISKDVPQRLKEDLPNARLVFVSHCGHLPHVEKPEAVAKLITEFCRT